MLWFENSAKYEERRKGRLLKFDTEYPKENDDADTPILAVVVAKEGFRQDLQLVSLVKKKFGGV